MIVIIMEVFFKRSIAILLMLLSIVYTSAIFAYPNDPDGFRTFDWGTSKEYITDLRVYEKYGGYVEYIKINEVLDFEGNKATRILYGFTDDNLESVTVQFEPPDDTRYDDLRKKLIAKYGEGEAMGEKDIFWRGGKTNSKLSVYGNGVEIIYFDNRTFSKRLNTIDEFNARFSDYWNELLKDYDAKTAATKIKQWLGQEGKNLLYSYQVSPNGEQISLNFKGGGTYLFSPSPLNIKQEAESKDVYSVEEVLNILRTTPERFKGKDVFLKAAVVDGVMGLGCNDFLMLTDLKYVDLYGKKYNQDLTIEEKEAIRNIPIVISGPSLSMPKGITSMEGESIYRGHFFDNSMKSCDEGWKRFVITDKK